MKPLRSLACVLLLGIAAFAQGNNPNGAPPNISVSQINFPLLTVLPPVTQANVAIVGNPGTSTYYYWLVANYTFGQAPLSHRFSLTNAPTILTGTNYVTVTPVYPSGATSVDLLRTTSPSPPSGTGNYAVSTGNTSGPISDTGGALSSYTVNAASPDNFTICLTNQVVGAGESHLILSQGTPTDCIFVTDLSEGGSGGGGTVTNFSAGNLSPLFTTSVATSTTTPALTFSLTNAPANTIFGNLSGSTGPPSYIATQGTDSKVLTAGVVSGASIALCTDANGGATTVGCPGAGGGVTGSGTVGTIPEWGSTTTSLTNSPIVDGGTAGITITNPATGLFTVTSGSAASDGSLQIAGASNGTSLATYLGNTSLANFNGSAAQNFGGCSFLTDQVTCSAKVSTGGESELKLVGSIAGGSTVGWELIDANGYSIYSVGPASSTPGQVNGVDVNLLTTGFFNIIGNGSDVFDIDFQGNVVQNSGHVFFDSYLDFEGISSPGNPVSGNGRVFFSGGLLNCLTSTGANCLPSSGTVNSGTIYQISQYPASGTAVSGDTIFTDNGSLVNYTGPSGMQAVQFGAGLGTASAPSLYFTAAPAVGWYLTTDPNAWTVTNTSGTGSVVTVTLTNTSGWTFPDGFVVGAPIVSTIGTGYNCSSSAPCIVTAVSGSGTGGTISYAGTGTATITSGTVQMMMMAMSTGAHKAQFNAWRSSTNNCPENGSIQLCQSDAINGYDVSTLSTVQLLSRNNNAGYGPLASAIVGDLTNGFVTAPNAPARFNGPTLIEQYEDDIGAASAPANPGSGICRRYFNTTTGLETWINSTGGSCSPTGTFSPTITSPAQSQGLTWNGTTWVNAYGGVAVTSLTASAAFSCPSERLGEVDYDITTTGVTFTLPQAGSTGCTGSSMALVIRNASISTQALSVAATTSTFQPEGTTSLNILPGGAVFIYSDAVGGTGNYHDLPIPTTFGGVNLQTASYALANTDKDKLILANCSSACAMTLPNPPPSAKFNATILSIGSTVATVSLNSLDYNGGVTAPVLISDMPLVFRSDGSNYFGDAPLVAGTNVSFSPAPNGLTINVSSTGGSVSSVATGGGLTGGPITTTGTLYNTAQATPLDCADTHQYSGASPDAQITSCIAALPGGGGVIDLGGFHGTQTMLATVTVPSNVTVLVPAGVTFVPTSNSVTAAFTVTGSGVTFKGADKYTSTFDWSGVSVTGTTNAVINVTGSASSDFTMTGIHIKGPRIINGDTGTGQACVRVSPGAANYITNISVTDNFLEQCGSYGINVNDASNVDASRNLIEQPSTAAVQFNTGTISNQEYRDWRADFDTIYEGNTSKQTGVATINFINPNTGTGATVRNAHADFNTIRGDIIGGDGSGNIDTCNQSGTSTATMCGQGIEFNNILNGTIIGNFIRNTNAEGISVINGGAGVIVANNTESLTGATSSGTITTAGAGCVLLFYSNNNTSADNAVEVAGNDCSDSGYAVSVTLGNAVTTTGVNISNVNIHDNKGYVVNQALIRGFRWVNSSGTGCSGSLCTYTMTNVKVHDNQFLGWTTSGMDLTDENGGNTGAPLFECNQTTTSTWGTCTTNNIALGGGGTFPAWTTNGIGLSAAAATFTDNSSSGTVATQGVYAFGVPTLVASNSTTYTASSTVYIAGAPVSSTNVTQTASYGLNVNAKILGVGVTSTSGFTGTPLEGSGTGTNVQVAGGLGTTSVNSIVGGLQGNGSDNSNTGSGVMGGYGIFRGGELTATTPNAAALEGVTQVGGGYLKGSAIANVGDVVCGTTTAFTVTDCPITPGTNVIGIATNTANPVGVVSYGTALVKLDGALTAIGDNVCGSTTTAGEGHDNGSATTACTLGTSIGVIIADSGTITTMSGNTTAATAMSTTLVLVQLHIGQ